MDPLEGFRREVVAELYGAQFGEAAVLDEVGADALLVVVVHHADGGDVGAVVGGVPGIEQALAFVEVGDVKTAPEVGLALEVADDIDALHALPEHGEIPILILQIDIQAPGEIGHGRVDPLLILLVDDTVLVEVLPADAAEACSVLGGVVVDFVLALEDAVVDVAYLCAHGMTYDALDAVAAEGAVGSESLGQLGNLVAIGADIAGEVVAEVANLAAITDVELDALVLHLASVDPLAGSFAHDADAGHIDEDVGGLLVVPLEGAVEGVAQETEVEADVRLSGGLPLQVVVAELVALEAAGQLLAAVGACDVVAGAVALAAEACFAVVAHVESVACDVVDLLVTRTSPAGAQLQVVEPAYVLHELLLADAPTCAERGEGTIAVVLAEARAAVVADGDAGQVAVVEVVVGFSKERYEREAAGTAVSFGLAHGCVGPHIRRSEHCEVVGLAAEPAVVLTVQLHTCQGVDVVLACLEAVAGHGVPHPLCPVLLLGLDGIGGVGHGAFGDRIGEDALLFLSVVEAEGALDVEVLEWIDVDERIAEHAPVCVAIVGIARQACQRVLAVGIAADRTCEAAIGGIYGERGIELKDVLEESARSLHLAGAVDGEVLAHGDDVAVVNLQ